MAAIKTIQFLPEIFRTDTNRKFLNATLDQLVSEPQLKKINGYIGRKKAPSYKVGDSYITEVDTDRQNYQLEPSLIIKDALAEKIEFATTYPDIINQIGYYGGITDQHDRLFDSEYYSYNPHIDLDKFINFSQYYWLKNGPNSVSVTASGVPLNFTFIVDYDSVTNSYRFTGQETRNPTLTLARGGTYEFVVNNQGNEFYIQAEPGVDGQSPRLPNINTRNVLGVINNGQDVGVVKFQVPTAAAQVEWTSMPTVGLADYATDLSFQQIQGADPNELNNLLGGIDGITTSLEGKKIIFVNNDLIDDEFWNDSPVVIADGVAFFEYYDMTDFEEGNYDSVEYVEFTKRNDVFQIRLYPDVLGRTRIVLTPDISVTDETKIKVRAGDKYASTEFYSRNDILLPVPLITAPLDFLYYQNGADSDAVGSIRIVEPLNETIDPDLEIIGRTEYTSPNGVIFTNGLKITFDSTATENYKNKTYYIEGVGTSIRLVLADNLVVPELDNNLDQPDYLTIERSSIDQNAWSRSNRWFHSDIIQKTADYNNVDAIFDQTLRASRPIIEFEEDLQLFNFGTLAKAPVDILDNVITNAYVQVQGVVCSSPTSHTFVIDGSSVTLTSGTRVVFAADENNDVRNKIYNFTIELTNSLAPFVYKAYIQEAQDTLVEQGHTIFVNTGTNGKKQWHYNGTNWILSQQKTKVNQHPLFDVIDSSGTSLSGVSTYPGSSFTGTKIFSYKVGTGDNDPILGFPLSYKNFTTQGDIQFENNFDFDTFEYLVASGTSSVATNSGLLQKNLDRDKSIRLNIWNIVEEFSKQFQVYTYVYDGVNNLFPIDLEPEISTNTPNRKVTINSKLIPTEDSALVKVVDRLAVSVNPDLLKQNDVVFVEIYTTENAAPNAYYEIPINLDINSLNTNFTTVTLGQMRNHLIAISNKSLNISGDVPGKSNLRDLQYNNKSGSILQHSAPVIYSGLFLSHPTMNFVSGIKLAANEYNKFKIRFLELAANLDLDRNNIAGSVDTIISTINELKNAMFPWYYSDMVPYSIMENTKLPTYTVINPAIRSYEISRIMRDNVIQNKAVLVYLTRTVENVTSTELLVKGQDYVFDQTRPAINFLDSFTLLYDDKIDIVEYTNTDGSYIPETPTKLGLYPKFVPNIFVDNTYVNPITVIQGHDGSITPAFGDFRDNFLLELERRIYNNIKVDYNENNFDINDYVPGKFRRTNYTRQEFNQILSQSFLNWAGTARVDYATNDTFLTTNPFTWNYKKFIDGVNGESLPGTWRAIYKYFYDTERPHTHPWEMLGFSIKPDYWDDRYGPAPYTGGNAILWSDLSLGYIHAGNRAGFNIRYQRPNLAYLIPVDENGNLKAPTEIFGRDLTTGKTYRMVADFDSQKANTSYAVGDFGPAETAWRRSSDYPYALQTALALSKPAKYFSLLSNVKNFYRNDVTAQFVVETTGQHITPTSIKVNGFESGTDIERSAGYINWIRDYIKNLGIENASGYIKDNLSKLTVQLTYKVGGYTDKKIVNLLAEQSSPTSINDSVIIPDENYRIELYKGSPIGKLIYSAVIVTKTQNGYQVSGYDRNNPYFYIIPSLVNNNSYVVTQSNQRGVIYNDYKKTKLVVPYGFEFSSRQQVVDFIVGYQRYLVSQGFIFTDYDTDLNQKKDWILSVKEFLHWISQGWKPGSLLVLSPVSNQIKVFDELSVVDEIKNTPFSSKVLDVNNNIITKNNFTIIRENNVFTFKALKDQTIALAEFNLIQYEHLLILDNQTVFQDIIYSPESGNRQYRIKVIGSKTDNWNGSLELPGFVYSSPLFDEWQPGNDYLKGSIVKHKSRYYTALQNITASDTFQTNFWKLIPTNELKSGILNNFSTNARQAINFYDIDNQPLDETLQLFSNGLIGYRNRDFFTNLGIDVTTQSKFYQGLIKQKGTNNSIVALRGARFNNINTDINIYENWAVRVGEYGALDNNQFVELALDENLITLNPATVQFIDDTIPVEPESVAYKFTDLYKVSGDWTPNIFKTQQISEAKLINPLPTAGFVYSDDVDTTLFDLENYSSLTPLTNQIGTGYKIWTARDLEKSWNVFRVTPIRGITFAIKFVIDNIIEVFHNQEHGLVVDDIIVIKNFDSRYDGFYRVKEIKDLTVVYVELYQNLETLIELQAVVGEGILFKLISLKVNNPSKVDAARPRDGWSQNDKIWVENLDQNENWGVYNKEEPWLFDEKIALNESQYIGNDEFGSAISINENGTIFYAGAPKSDTGRVAQFQRSLTADWSPSVFYWGNSNLLSGYGSALANGNNYLAIGAPTSNQNKGVVYVYNAGVLIQILTPPTSAVDDYFGKSLAMSADGRFIYVGCPGADKVFCYALNATRTETSENIITDGVTSTYTVAQTVAAASELIITAPLRSKEYLPEYEYTISQFSNGINTFSSAGTANGGSATYYGVTGTGGSGTGAIFTVVKNGSTYTASLVNAGSGYTAADTITIPGTSLGATSPVYDLTITVTTVRNGSNITFVDTAGTPTPPLLNERISCVQRLQFYSLIQTLTSPVANNSFGSTLSVDTNGEIIVIGAETETVDGFVNSGAVYVYHRTVSVFTTDGIVGTYNLPNPFNTIRQAKLNDIVLVEGVNYYIVASSIQFASFYTPAKAQILTVETNQFVFDQKIISIKGDNYKFGSVLDLCATGCNIVTGAIGYQESNYQTGIVSRIVNIGRVYGQVIGDVKNPVLNAGDSFVINNRTITLTSSSLNSLVSLINNSAIPGVAAEVYDNRIKITSVVITPGQKLDIKQGTGTVLDDLGLEIYKTSQLIKHPETSGEVFGTSISLKPNATMLAVASQGADTELFTTFDSASTSFDTKSTKLVDFINDSGAVYIFDLMINPFEDVNNPSLFSYTQKLTGPGLETGFNFGAALDTYGDFIAVGTTNDYEVVTGGGTIYSYLNAEDEPGWKLIRSKQPRVDVDALNTAFLYDSSSQLLINYFDYIDPAKGKLLGTVDQEIDYRETFDPAVYNQSEATGFIQNDSFYWTKNQVGRTWWDLSVASFIDYEQGSLVYRAKNWGKLFPGSQVVIYEWIESNVLPSQHVNAGLEGIPKYTDDSAYSTMSFVDKATGIIKQTYYYWVRNKTSVDPIVAKRTLSITSLEKYILNPKDQGIPYLALLAPNAVAMFNANEFLRDNEIVLHLDISKNRSQNLIHNEYQMIQQENPVQIFPGKIIDKMRDSLAGFDIFGATVPDPNLNVRDRYGLSFKPRQSIFINRLSAVKTYVQTLNNILFQYPILLTTIPSTLYSEDPLPTSGFDDQVDSFNQISYIETDTFGDGYRILVPQNSDYGNRWTLYKFVAATDEFQLDKIQAYKTTRFWTALDWYDLSFDPGSKIDFIVATYGDIQTLNLTAGDLVRVTDNGNGQWLIYEVQPDLSLNLRGAQNATLSLNTSIFDVSQGSGFESTVYDQIDFDPQIGTEFVKIFDSIFDEILIGDLSIEFNRLFFAMVNYLFTEQVAPDWIFKTSFIDVYHNLRQLEQIPNYVKDDQTFYENYINEIKPYRTKLREYLPIYDNLDISTETWSDFDLPGRYDKATNTFISPGLNNPLSYLLNEEPFVDWTNNYKLKIVDFIIGNVGVNYSFAPNVEITGGGGSGAEAITTVNPATGRLTGVIVTNPGSGYTSTPTVTINGVGSGATIYPVLKNEYFVSDPTKSYNLIRSVKTYLKFDRYDYTSANIVNWPVPVGTVLGNTVITSGGDIQSNIWVTSGNIYIYNNEAYILKSNLTVASTNFDFTLFTKLDSGNTLLTATNRISAYYQPSIGMPNNSFAELMSGITYPGVEVQAAKFTANSFEIVSDEITFDYIGLTITSSNVSAVNFTSLGFEIDQSIRIQAQTPFDFKNNGYFTIVSVDRDSMMLTGGPIETTYKMFLSSPITANVGDIITQANTSANAFVLKSVINSSQVDIIHTDMGFDETGNIIVINGVPTSTYVVDITTGGNANVKISYLELDTSVLDSNIYSKYDDSLLGFRPEDINIDGGAYVDIYESHAPEELVPGRMFDALQIKVFSNTAANTQTYGFRIFNPMSGNAEITRISANATTTLAANLHLTDSVIYVTDASKLPDPGPVTATPGVVFINGEKIHYYQRYDSVTLSTALNWLPNTSFAVDSLVNIDVGTLYSNVASNVSNVTFDILRYANTYVASPNLQGVGQTVGNVYVVTGNLLGGTSGVNDALLTAETLANTVVGNIAVVSVTGSPAAPTSQIYRVTGNVYANANSYVNTANLQVVYNNTLSQIRRGVDGTGAANIILAGNLVSDSSREQLIPNSSVFASNITANLTVAEYVTFKLTLSQPITANVGDFITQFSNANVRVLESVTNSNVVAVNQDTVFPLTAPVVANTIAFRINVVTTTSTINTTANVLSYVPLGEITSNANVYVNQTIFRSNIWEQLGNTLQYSPTIGAQFIRAEPSYIP